MESCAKPRTLNICPFKKKCVNSHMASGKKKKKYSKTSFVFENKIISIICEHHELFLSHPATLMTLARTENEGTRMDNERSPMD